MLIAQVLGMALTIAVAAPADDSGRASNNLSAHQKNTAMQPLVRSATECIARTVISDPRYHSTPGNLGDLIVESMSPCMGPVRAMINAYDHYFGEGTGEAFFMGPYLDVLPTAVTKWANDKPASE